MKGRVRLTDEQALKMSAEYNLLLEQAATQLSDHKDWLVQQIYLVSQENWEEILLSKGGASCSLTEYTARILIDIYQLKIAQVIVEPHARDNKGELTLSIMYEYPLELYAFLRNEKTPKALRDTLAGGIDID